MRRRNERRLHRSLLIRIRAYRKTRGPPVRQRFSARKADSMAHNIEVILGQKIRSSGHGCEAGQIPPGHGAYETLSAVFVTDWAFW